MFHYLVISTEVFSRKATPQKETHVWKLPFFQKRFGVEHAEQNHRPPKQFNIHNTPSYLVYKSAQIKAWKNNVNSNKMYSVQRLLKIEALTKWPGNSGRPPQGCLLWLNLQVNFLVGWNSCAVIYLTLWRLNRLDNWYNNWGCIWL